MVPRIAEALEAIAPGVAVMTRPCESDPGQRSSGRPRLASGTEMAGESFILQISYEEREVGVDVEAVVRIWAARHPLSVRLKVISEW